MLLTDETALEKANEIIRQSGEQATVSDWFWLRAEEEKERLLAHVWDPYSLSLMSWLIE